MLLSYNELVDIALHGVIKDVSLENINAASIDITLGKKILKEEFPLGNPQGCLVRLRDRQPLTMRELDCTDGVKLFPGEFILAQSSETFYLPNDISAEYKLKSSMARIGLNHCLAGWCDAGWNGSVLTLELMNVSKYHTIELKAGDKIGQMVFFRHTEVPADRSYATRGRYNNDKEVQVVKE